MATGGSSGPSKATNDKSCHALTRVVGPTEGLRVLFEASSIAVVGASKSENKIGHIVVRNIIDSGYRGELYPVNPRADVILGRRCYPDLAAIPGEVEMAVVTVPNHSVPQVMEDAGGRG
jgi:acetyl-CoA synthetase (ADP-forming)